MRSKILNIVSVFTLILFLPACNFVPADGYPEPICEEDEFLVENECILPIDYCSTGYYYDNGSCYEIIEDEDDNNTEEEGIKVYYQKPLEWDGLYVYYYATNLDEDLAWNESPSMTPWFGKVGWYYYEFESDITYARVVFRDSGNNQIPIAGTQGVIIFEDTWFYEDYTQTTVNPYE